VILSKLRFINLPRKALLSVHGTWRQKRLISRITKPGTSHVANVKPPEEFLLRIHRFSTHHYPELHVHDIVEETRSKYHIAPVVRITHYQTPGVLQTLKTPIQTVKQVAKRSAPIPGPTGGKHANSTGQRDLHSWSARVTDSGSISCSCSAGVRVGEATAVVLRCRDCVLVLKFSRFLVVRSGARESDLEGAVLSDSPFLVKKGGFFG
jgi:hypothetical protein